jgi:hypothetical protein
MNFTMAVTRSNLPYIWGKNVRLNPSYLASGFNLLSKPVSDSTYPRYIPGVDWLESKKGRDKVCSVHFVVFVQWIARYVTAVSTSCRLTYPRPRGISTS